MIYLNQNDLKKCFDIDNMRQSMADALVAFSSKKATNFPRAVFTLNNKYQNPIAFMPSFDIEHGLLGYKAIAIFHQNVEHHLNPHQGMVVLLNEQTGQVKCILDGTFVTAIRTAAVSAVATDKLSRKKAQTLALIGAGRQAYEHIIALSKVRPIQHVKVFCRQSLSFDKLCDELQSLNLNLTLASTPQEAVNNSDIIVTCTSSKTSLLNIKDVPEGAHINAIGACRPGDCELTLQDRAGLKIYLDSEKSCLLESDEILKPLEQNLLSQDSIIGELGDCITNNIPSRNNESEITVFKSIGISIEDLYAAECLYQNAIEHNIGQKIEP